MPRRADRALTVVGVLLSMFMAAMEATIVATAMPTVVEQLGGIQYYGWVGAVYLLTSTVTMPLYGKLCDLYGRKPIMMLGMVIFLAGSLASGLSQSMTQLIVFRALQGAGAGGLQPVSITMIGDLFRPQERARIQGAFGAVWAVAAMSGPLLGGLIVRALSWRWVFFINLPFGLLSSWFILQFFHEHKVTRQHRIDFGGALLLTAAIVALLLGAGRFETAWMLPLAAVLLAGFAAVEMRAKEPVLSLSLLARPLIGISSAAGAAVGAVMSATVNYLPLYAQGVLGGSPTQAGLTVSPMLLGWPIASSISGRLIVRHGARPLVRIGFAVVMLTSLALPWQLRNGAPMLLLGTTMFVMGAGMGCANIALLIAVQESVVWRERGVATASALFFRTIGGAVAVGALGAVLVAAMGPEVPESTLNRLLAPDHGAGLDPALAAHVSRLLRFGLHHVFDVIGLISVLALLVALPFPRQRLGMTEEVVEPVAETAGPAHSGEPPA
ncbi:MAG TPA: MDR family MFS transporter [Steroidobacteraceae bacterium]|nr:MDR family MFS transporter [Steroidobacteraceae bacterium]